MTIQYVHPDMETERFLLEAVAATIHGNCYPIAIALHRGLDWPLIGLTDGKDIIHVGVRAPSGLLWDGRGELTEEEFRRPFSALSSFTIQDISECDLFDKSYPAAECWIEVMLKRAQLAWPSLPWKVPTPQNRVMAFASELEALSRKHGIWVCGMTPMSLPILCECPTNEAAGYKVELTAEGNAFTINRTLGQH